MFIKTFRSFGAGLLAWAGVTLLTPQAQAQITLQGQVRDNQGQGLYAASLYAPQAKVGALTDESGRFTLALPQGQAGDSILLRISLPGYQTFVGKVASGENVQLVLGPNPFFQEEVVVDAVRASERMPVTQTTLERRQIEAQYFGQDLTQTLMLTPNVNASFQSGNTFTNYSEIRMRGMDQSRINITLNGVPLNDMIDQGVFFSNFTDFGNSVESMQIQRGVGTSTNGVASYAGSINFESVYLKDTVASSEVQLGYGSFNSARFSAEHKTGLLKNNWAFYGKYSGLRTDGYREHSGSRATSFFLSGAWFGAKDLVKVTAFSGRTKNRMAYLPSPLSEIRRNPRHNPLTPNMSDDFGQDLVSVQHSRQVGRATTWVNTLYYGGAQGDFEASDDFILSLKNRHFGAFSQLSYTEKSGRQYHLGAGANRFLRENYASLQPQNNVRLYTNRSVKDEASAFAKITNRVGWLTAFVDLQVRYASYTYIADPSYNLADIQKSWGFFNPKLGLMAPLSAQTDVYFSLGRTSREPTRRDLLGDLDDITAANYTELKDFGRVKPETVYDMELGTTFRSSRFSGQVNGFYMTFRNEIANTGVLTPWGEFLRKNVDRSYRAGVEAMLGWQVLSWLKLENASSYTKAEIEEYSVDANTRFQNVTPLMTPAWMLSQSARLTLLKGLDLSLTARYVSDAFLANNKDEAQKNPEYWLVDTRLNWTFWGRHSLSVYVNNVFDTRYYVGGTAGVDANGQADPAYFIQAPRNAFATLFLRF